MNPRLEDLDDEALVRIIQERDPGVSGAAAATCTLLDRWQERIYRWVWRWVREREEALDVTQDCLVSLARALPAYQSRGTFGAWVFTIVRHRCLSALRTRMLRRDPEVELESLAGAGPGPDEQAEQREREDRVLGAIERVLDADERLALWLRAYEGMSVEDITRAMSLRNASGARGLLQAARRKLRAELGGPAEEEHA